MGDADATALLHSWADGDHQAAQTLIPLVYNELRELARILVNRLPPGQTLQPTALVHEAYLRLINRGDPGWHSARHFYRAAALAMRHILVDKARKRQSKVHGGGRARVDLSDDLPIRSPGLHATTVLALDEALNELQRLDPVKFDIVQLRFFLGATVSETAEVLGLSVSTVERQWPFIKRWLGTRLSDEDNT